MITDHNYSRRENYYSAIIIADHGQPWAAVADNGPVAISYVVQQRHLNKPPVGSVIWQLGFFACVCG